MAVRADDTLSPAKRGSAPNPGPHLPYNISDRYSPCVRHKRLLKRRSQNPYVLYDLNTKNDKKKDIKILVKM